MQRGRPMRRGRGQGDARPTRRARARVAGRRRASRPGWSAAARLPGCGRPVGGRGLLARRFQRAEVAGGGTGLDRDLLGADAAPPSSASTRPRLSARRTVRAGRGEFALGGGRPGLLGGRGRGVRQRPYRGRRRPTSASTSRPIVATGCSASGSPTAAGTASGRNGSLRDHPSTPRSTCWGLSLRSATGGSRDTEGGAGFPDGAPDGTRRRAPTRGPRSAPTAAPRLFATWRGSCSAPSVVPPAFRQASRRTPTSCGALTRRPTGRRRTSPRGGIDSDFTRTRRARPRWITLRALGASDGRDPTPPPRRPDAAPGARTRALAGGRDSGVTAWATTMARRSRHAWITLHARCRCPAAG